MDKLIINGPSKLKGSVRVSSSKNATLPILASTLLFKGDIHFRNLPHLNDVVTTFSLLKEMGVKIEDGKDTTIINASDVSHFVAPYDLVRKMRASILVLGPLLSRFGEAEVSLPGGCAIGTRPIDIHLEGLKQMGAEIELESGYVKAHCKKLKGADIKLSFPSVGATENLMMAAVYADGTTTIKNAAKEPEIKNLEAFLKQNGVDISGSGTESITIKGSREVLESNSKSFEVISDRIEAVTYVVAALITNSELTIENCIPSDFAAVIELLESVGAKFEASENTLKVLKWEKLNPLKFETEPYPGIPTDVQAQLMSLATSIPGQSEITEKIFENRFMHVPELNRMGADIALTEHTATINGGRQLKGAPVMCTDLRASAALVLAAMTADSQTEVNRVYHLDRGYEKLDEKLTKIGCNIKRVK
jgi:UDP-N-acetylglucosamine 1-carboxyvinyltransferase